MNQQKRYEPCPGDLLLSKYTRHRRLGWNYVEKIFVVSTRSFIIIYEPSGMMKYETDISDEMLRGLEINWYLLRNGKVLK